MENSSSFFFGFSRFDFELSLPNAESALMLLILMTQHLDGQGGIDPQWRPRQSALAVALTKSLLHSLPPELLLQPLMTIKLLKGYDFLREESFYLFSARDSAAAALLPLPKKEEKILFAQP